MNASLILEGSTFRARSAGKGSVYIKRVMGFVWLSRRRVTDSVSECLMKTEYSGIVNILDCFVHGMALSLGRGLSFEGEWCCFQFPRVYKCTI